jgi:hypothetical protein
MADRKVYELRILNQKTSVFLLDLITNLQQQRIYTSSFECWDNCERLIGSDPVGKFRGPFCGVIPELTRSY